MDVPASRSPVLLFHCCLAYASLADAWVAVHLPKSERCPWIHNFMLAISPLIQVLRARAVDAAAAPPPLLLRDEAVVPAASLPRAPRRTNTLAASRQLCGA